MENTAIARGFQKRAYNGSYSAGHGSIGQGRYAANQYQHSPAKEGPSATQTAGIAGATALSASELAKRKKMNMLKSQAQKKMVESRKAPGPVARMIGGGAIQEHANRMANRRGEAKELMSRAQKVKGRTIGNKLSKGFRAAKKMVLG